MQVTAAVVQVIQVLAGGKGQCGQVAERIVVVGQRALGRRFLCQAVSFSAVIPSFLPSLGLSSSVVVLFDFLRSRFLISRIMTMFSMPID
jgi:hypothetical protein